MTYRLALALILFVAITLGVAVALGLYWPAENDILVVPIPTAGYAEKVILDAQCDAAAALVQTEEKNLLEEPMLITPPVPKVPDVLKAEPLKPFKQAADPMVRI